MAFTGNAVANSFKQQLLQGQHNFTAATGNVFKLALYTSAATLTSATTVYTSTGEVSPTGQYTTGGGVLANVSPLVSSGVAFINFADISFTGVTLTAAGALIYNTSAPATNAAVCVLDFGSDKTATSGTFTIQFPAATTTAAILRIGNA
jgi:hypothetical protein